MAKKKEISEKEIVTQNEMRDLEQFYTEGKVDNMLSKIEEKKQELIEDMVNYAANHTKPCKWDKDGCPIDYKVEMNPLVINNYFFKSIIPIQSQEPQYNAEKLALVFDYY